MGIKGYAKNRKAAAATPQSEPIEGTVANSAGGYSFAVDSWKRLDRFLILGSEGGTYYITEKNLTKENASVVEECFKADPKRTADRIEAVSVAGLAPKNDPAIFALAIGVGMGGEARARALLSLSRVCRIGTHLFHFMEFIRRADVGMGKSVQKTLRNWYTAKRPEALVNQMIKYQSRDGWSHRDVLRLARPKPWLPTHQAMYRWAVKGDDAYREVRAATAAGDEAALARLDGFLALKGEKDVKKAVNLIAEHRLPRECVPTELMTKPEIWAALFPSMGMTAMIRNLGNMSKVGLLTPYSATAKAVVERLGTEDLLKKERVHPFGILLALTTYQAGRGVKGHGTWEPVPSVIGALDAAFYKAFQFVKPTGKRIYIGLDVSSSMDGSMIAGSHLSARCGAVAMAMATARTEPDFYVGAFSDCMRPFSLSKSDSLAAVVRRSEALPFGGTDCALPMIDAMERKAEVDAFIIYTDSETWAGHIHPKQALKRYREKFFNPAKLIVVGMTSNGFSIADPKDAGMLDVVGFDASAPAVLSDFIAEREPEGSREEA